LAKSVGERFCVPANKGATGYGSLSEIRSAYFMMPADLERTYPNKTMYAAVNIKMFPKIVVKWFAVRNAEPVSGNATLTGGLNLIVGVARADKLLPAAVAEMWLFRGPILILKLETRHPYLRGLARRLRFHTL